jgi:hypothetical protein
MSTSSVHRTATILLALLPCISLACAAPNQENGHSPPPSQTGTVDRAALERWRDARFGMFIHWGPVSLKGTEIGWPRGGQIPRTEYDALPQRFDPVDFDADEWARVAKEARMKYMILTAKHHDGLCLWNSALTSHDLVRRRVGGTVDHGARPAPARILSRNRARDARQQPRWQGPSRDGRHHGPECRDSGRLRHS